MFSEKPYADLARSFGSLPLDWSHAEDSGPPPSSHHLNSFYLFTLDCTILKFSRNMLYA